MNNQEYLNNKYLNKLFYVVIIAIFLGLLILAYSTINSKDKYYPNDQVYDKKIEVVDEKNDLEAYTTKKERTAIINRLTDYTLWQDADPNTKVIIKKVTTPIRDIGNTTIIVDIPELKQYGLAIIYNYYTQPYPIFSIPSKNYSAPLYEQTQ